MKKIFSYIVIALMMVGLIIPTSIIHAQSISPTILNSLRNQGANGANPQISTNPPPTDNGCSATTLICFSKIFANIAYLILGLMSLLLWAAGTLLDWVLNYTVINMANHINGSADGTMQALVGINVAWKVIRDLMNIAFIFLLVYEGIKMILGLDKNGAQKLVVGIILSSLLINFSLFFTKVIIDASNIVTIGFYKSVIQTSPDTQFNTSNGTMNIKGLSVPFMTATGVTSFYGTGGFDALSNSVQGNNTSLIIIGLAGSILFVVIAFVFFAISIMFIVRYIVLIFVLMLSPIGFMGMALPGINNYSKQWWDTLIGQCLFAPIYMIITWVILTLMSSPGFITPAGPGSWGKLLLGDAGKADPGSIGLLFNFALVIGLAILSLTVAKSFASKGSTMISQFTGQATAFAGGAILGTAATIGRNTAGRAGNALANNETLKDKEATGGFVTRNLAKMTRRTGEKAAGSTFDARATSGFESLSKATKVSFGKPDKKKDNFKAILDARVKSAEETSKKLKTSDSAADDAKTRLASAEFTEQREESRKNDFIQKTTNEIDNRKKLYEVELERLGKTDPALYAQIRERNNPATSEARKAEITADLNKRLEFDKSLQNKLKNINDVEKTIVEKQKAIDEARKLGKVWVSDERKALIAKTGGQEEKKDNKGNITQLRVESEWAKRAGAYADKVENENGYMRYAKNLFRVTAVTPEDSHLMAMKIRSTAKAKKPKEEFEELLKKAGITPEKEEEPKAEPAAAPAAAA